MNNVIKIVLIIASSMVIAFAQAADTTAKQQTSSPAASATVSPANGKSIATKVTPKAPTNWSKIKDLFL
jgi:hypothetical protein